MKILSLNTWGGRAGHKEVLDFLKKHKEVDVFCLQEIWQGGEEKAREWSENMDTTMFDGISDVLPEYTGYFRPHWGDFFGLAIFVKKNLNLKEEGEVFVFRNKENIHDAWSSKHPRNLQYVTIETPSGLRTILNLHGLWTGKDKDDNEDRIIQSKNILAFIKNISNPVILCGDFNLSPETKSLKMFTESGLRDLINEFGITSTRSSHYKKPVKFADYVFVSKEIEINDFKVLPDEVSDHLALIVDFN
jgi:endonuclease/exonuclease/phosphatase family metal-dependent hydrolase